MSAPKSYHVHHAPREHAPFTRHDGTVDPAHVEVRYRCDRNGRPWQGVKVKRFPTLLEAERWVEHHGCECS